MSSLKVEYRSIEKLIPYARNARTHSDAQVAQIAASIKEFGFTNPILVDGENGIIAGHGRLAASRKLGLKDVPCIELSGLSDAQRRAYVLADNKIALNSGWDMDLLKVELQDIGEMSFDLDKIGFGVGEMAAFFDEPNFAPGGEDDQGKLDELSPKMILCPHCGDEFDLRKHGEG